MKYTQSIPEIVRELQKKGYKILETLARGAIMAHPNPKGTVRHPKVLVTAEGRILALSK